LGCCEIVTFKKMDTEQKSNNISSAGRAF